MQWRNLLPRRGIDIEKQPSRLIVTAYRHNGVVLIIFAMILCLWLFGFVRQEWNNPVSMLFGLTIFFFMIFGLGKSPPRHMVTLFDLDKHKVQQVARTRFSGRVVSTITCSFAEIENLGMKESYNEGYAYVPVIVLKTGGHCPVGIEGGSAVEAGQIIDAICAATDLPRVDIAAK